MDHPFPKSTTALERVRRLRELVTGDDSLAVLIDADPDAMASALALRRIFWRRAKKIDVFHVNTIQRADNLAMIRLLKIELKPVSEIEPERFTRWALVDSQPSHHQEFSRRRFDIVIDHHPVNPQTTGLFVDIREQYGANSTIMTELLRAAKIRPSARLATALFYGIKTDTGDFVKGSLSNDINALRYLYPFANMNIIKKIESSEMTRRTLESYKLAMERVLFYKGVAFTYMDRVESPDVLVLVADFFMKLAEATWSIASGLFDDRLIVIFRNAGLKGDAGRAAQRISKKIGGSGGGHKSAGRAEVPLENVLEAARGTDGLSRFVLRQIKRLKL
jgi:nanoRNase/pAp phosphatase (c-di-AMP/oligoRNAs hydrolase)